MEFRDIIYTKYDGRAKIAINRPEKLNAFTNFTLDEMIRALADAWADKEVGVSIITGVGDRAFSVGGAQSLRTRRATTLSCTATGVRGGSKTPPAPISAFSFRDTDHTDAVSRRQGYASGAARLHVVSRLRSPRNGQVRQVALGRPASTRIRQCLLAVLSANKGARDLVSLRKYTAGRVPPVGLVNRVVEPDKLEEDVERSGGPFSLTSDGPGGLKVSVNADSESIWGSIAGGRGAQPLNGTEAASRARVPFSRTDG